MLPDHLTGMRTERARDAVRFPGLTGAWLDKPTGTVYRLDGDGLHVVASPAASDPAAYTAIVEIVHSRRAPSGHRATRLPVKELTP